MVGENGSRFSARSLDELPIVLSGRGVTDSDCDRILSEVTKKGESFLNMLAVKSFTLQRNF